MIIIGILKLLSRKILKKYITFTDTYRVDETKKLSFN